MSKIEVLKENGWFGTELSQRKKHLLLLDSLPLSILPGSLHLPFSLFLFIKNAFS